MLYPNGTTTRPAVSSPFGPRPGVGAFSYHYGADLVGYSLVHAAGAGLVTFAGWMNAAAGYTVVCDLGGGYSELHMHLDYIAVRRGQRVGEGHRLGVAGRTGNATGICDHFEIRRYGVSIEPLTYVAARLTTPTPDTDTREEDDMIINIQGKTQHRLGGAYYIANGKATFLGGLIAGLPTLSSEQADALAARVEGI